NSIAFAASLKVNRGTAAGRTAAGTGTVSVAIFFFPSSCDFNRALKLALGRLRNSAAMRTNGSISLSTFGPRPSVRASMASTAWFSRSIFFASPLPGFRERLGIGTLHARPQTCQRTELQLLHRAFRLADLPRHFLDTFLLHKPQHHYSLLLRWQRLHQPKQRRPPFHLFEFRSPRRHRIHLFRLGSHLFPARALPAVRNQVARDPEQPCRKGNPSPLKLV